MFQFDFRPQYGLKSIPFNVLMSGIAGEELASPSCTACITIGNIAACIETIAACTAFCTAVCTSCLTNLVINISFAHPWVPCVVLELLPIDDVLGFAELHVSATEPVVSGRRPRLSINNANESIG